MKPADTADAILVIGDSFAADWSAVDGSYPGWPSLLGKRYRITNLAQAGCSEYRILQQLKSQPDLDQYQWIIVCHTTPARVYTPRHPIHDDHGLHQHADLIFSDIEYHAHKFANRKNQSLLTALDWFIYHYDDQYQSDVYQLIVAEINRLLAGRSVMVVDNFHQLDPRQYRHYVRFDDITDITPGGINHCTAEGNLKIAQHFLDKISEPYKVLPDLRLKYRRLAQLQYLAPHDPEFRCLDKTYPYQFDYQFNSRGFRDHEWPADTDLPQAIWCLGDSATIGVGCPVEHSWPAVLEHRIGRRTVKLAMVGASNDWIFRRAKSVLQEVVPSYMVIHWSFLHRREATLEDTREKLWQDYYQKIKCTEWPVCTYRDRSSLPDWIQQEIESLHNEFDADVDDEQRRLLTLDPMISDQAQVDYTVSLIQQLELMATNTVLIHSVVPGFAEPTARALFAHQMQTLEINFIPEFDPIDWAADQQHYDIKTSRWFVDQILSKMSLPAITNH